MLEPGVKVFVGPHHPLVLPLIEQATFEGQPVAVYPYAAGVTLREILDSYQGQTLGVPLDVLARVVIDASNALAKVTTQHGHDGLSDAAILVGFDGVTRVLDYGAPRGAGRFRPPSDSAGMPRDVFSWGAVLHSALTGFTGAYAGATELAAPSVFSQEITPALDDVVMTAISPQCESRQISIAQLATELEAVLGELALDASGVSALIKRVFEDRVTALIQATSMTVAIGSATTAPAPRSVLDDDEGATQLVAPTLPEEPPTQQAVLNEPARVAAGPDLQTKPIVYLDSNHDLPTARAEGPTTHDAGKLKSRRSGSVPRASVQPVPRPMAAVTTPGVTPKDLLATHEEPTVAAAHFKPNDQKTGARAHPGNDKHLPPIFATPAKGWPVDRSPAPTFKIAVVALLVAAAVAGIVMHRLRPNPRVSHPTQTSAPQVALDAGTAEPLEAVTDTELENVATPPLLDDEPVAPPAKVDTQKKKRRPR